jgi:hypothetical protein
MNFHCPEQTGGFSKLQIFLVESETSNWPVVLTDINSFQVNFNDTETFTAEVDEKIRVVERSKPDSNGEIWDIAITIDFITQNRNFDFVLDQYKTLKTVAVVTKTFNQQKIYGSDQFPLQFFYETINNENPEQGVITRVTLTGKQPFRPVYIVGQNISTGS